MTLAHSFFAATARGLSGLLAAELRELGIEQQRERAAGVEFTASLPQAYRVCLWSRIASRVQLVLHLFTAADADALYAGARELSWADHLPGDCTFAVAATQARSAFEHTGFLALKVKDAIVDSLRDARGQRPNVDSSDPDIRFHVHALRQQVTLSLDLSGPPLHRRGYRLDAVEAPLKENLAAALLIRAGWPRLAAQGHTLVDPMCGSGTLLIEGALMAAGRAPGLGRARFGFERWPGHDAENWAALLDEARGAAQRLGGHWKVAGVDHSARAVEMAASNIHRARLLDPIHVACADMSDARTELKLNALQGLLITNPPYGERMGQASELTRLYQDLGDLLRRDFGGWRVAVLSSNELLIDAIGLRPRRRSQVKNGALDCELVEYDLLTREQREQRAAAAAQKKARRRERAMSSAFAGRLRKNLRRIAPLMQQQEVSAYRLYDRDVPEYAVTVDRYNEHLLVQDFEAPPGVDTHAARERVREVLDVLPELCAVEPTHIVHKTRARQRGTQQYQRQDQRGETLTVREGPLRFEVNLYDYIDTGLFLDGRELRRLLLGRCQGRRVLNLFAYTGAASVAAILGGAKASTTVDLSHNYLDWAARNFAINEITTGRRHRLERADCLSWLKQTSSRFDLIYLDPPTFSNSKSMQQSFDIQRDHVELIQLAVEHLRPEGELIFVCNRRRFRLDKKALAELQIENLTDRSVPADFSHRPKIHQSFLLRRGGEGAAAVTD